MVMNIQYTRGLPVDEKAACGVKAANCQKEATQHICFEDGSGVYVCGNCFRERINGGVWITDSAEELILS